MTRHSITFRLLAIVAVAFVISSFCVLLLANYQLYAIIDMNQHAVYEEKLDSIIGTLKRQYERLRTTGMVETYETDFKDSVLKALKQTYYTGPDQKIYPFIIGTGGDVVMHPRLPYKDKSLQDKEYIQEALKTAQVDFQDTDQTGEQKWYFFKQFKGWNWVIGYAIPLEVKYADAAKLRNRLIVTMSVTTLLVLLSLSLLITRFTRPIITLTDISSEMAAGNLNQEIDIRSQDEIGVLARSFARMRDSILEKISDLDKNNQALHQEIAERRQAEKSLKEQHRFLQLLIDAIPISVFFKNTEGAYLGCNDAYAQFLGLSKDEIIGKKVHQVFPQDLADKYHEMDQRLFNAPGSQSYEAQMIHSDGSLHQALFYKATYEDDSGTMIGLIGAMLDITESKRLEKERVLLATAIEQAAESVIISNRPGTIQYVNPAFERLSGYAQDEIVGQNFRILKSDKHDEIFYIKMWDIVSQGKIWAGRITNRMKDGTLRVFETRISPVRDQTGEIVNFVSVNRDATQEVMLETQLRQAQKIESIGTLAGGIAHDFNNILSAVIGYTELAIDDVETGSLLYSNLQEVLIAGQRAKDLVKQILTFSRQTEQELKPIQVKLVTREVLKLLKATLPASIEIRHDILTDSLIMGDPTQIHQVLMNLCTNAGHAMQHTGGLLEVKLANVNLDAAFTASHPDLSSGAYVRLTVSDSGHGIPPDVMERIFDPFFTTKEKGTGTGMGLAVVHGIVKSHGGAIDVSSESKKGSVFTVYFPAIEKHLETDIRSEEPIPAGNERILFVDDEQAIVNMQRQALESLGYDVTTRTSSIEALDLFKAQPDRFDVVITDLTMPNMSGDKLAEELIRIRPDLPIILCTGFSAKIDEQKAGAIGIRAFILKPILKRKIAEAVRQVLHDV